MGYVLQEHKKQRVAELFVSGWSINRISRELRMNYLTVQQIVDTKLGRRHIPLNNNGDMEIHPDQCNRCPGCGHLVIMPCQICLVRTFKGTAQ